MTAVLQQLRRLDERLKKGDLSVEEHARRREAVLRAMDVIDTDFETVPRTTAHRHRASTAPAPSKPNHNILGFSIALCLGVMGVSMGAILLLLPDLTLALTVGVTILAALAVALMQTSDE